MAPGRPLLRHLSWCPVFKYIVHEKKNRPPWLLTVSSPWPKWSQLAVTEPWTYWRCRDWAVTSPWLSYDLAVTELWPRRDWAVTSPSRDWAVIIGPRSRDHRDHLFSHGSLCNSTEDWEVYGCLIFKRVPDYMTGLRYRQDSSPDNVHQATYLIVHIIIIVKKPYPTPYYHYYSPWPLISGLHNGMMTYTLIPHQAIIKINADHWNENVVNLMKF